MQVVRILKKINRTLLEMQIGLLTWGVVCQAAGCFLTKDLMYYTKSLWFGILFGIASMIHMYRTLDRGLDYSQKDASKVIFRGYLFRYVLFAGILFIIMVTEVMNPLIVFLAYMGMKVAAFLQPFTHKLCNRMFHETDPIPKPLLDEAAFGEEINEEGNAAFVDFEDVPGEEQASQEK